MKINIQSKGFSIDGLESAAKKNSFPDLLLIAGGKVAKAGGKAKFRITASMNGTRLKRWQVTVEYTPAGGVPTGNMFEGYLLTKDNIEGQQIDLKFEIDTGSGYVEYLPASVENIESPPLGGAVLGFDTGAGVTGLWGLEYMP